MMTRSASDFLNRPLLTGLAALLVGLAPMPTAHAHTVWLADGDAAGHYRLDFGGHAGRIESYDAAKLGDVQGFDAQGQALTGAAGPRVQRPPGPGPVQIEAPGAALLVVDFDNGYWSKGPDGRSLNRPMNEVPGARSGTHAMKFHKRIVKWSAGSTRAVGQPFELRPVSGHPPAAGEAVQFQVLIDGRPAPDVWLAFGEAGREARSDAQGIATLKARPGRNTVWAGRRTPVTGDPATTELSIEYSLVFDAR